VDRDISVPGGYFPLAMVGVGERTVLVTIGLCPDRPRRLWVKCLRFEVISNAGEPLGDPSFDAIGEWAGPDFYPFENGFFHLQDGLYEAGEMVRYELSGSSVARAGEASRLSDDEEGFDPPQVAFDGQRWAAAYSGFRDLYRSGGDKARLPAALVRSRRLTDMAWSGDDLIFAFKRGSRCEYVSVDPATGQPRGPVATSAAIGEMPSALAGRLHAGVGLEGRRLIGYVLDACRRDVVRLDLGAAGFADPNRHRARGVLDGDRLHLVYSVREGRRWSLRMRSGRCGG
jgi:hypothetical protein